ncbi:MAG: small basic protein [Planctomyces sp.]|nr:small basic protein [Planctomyces sp.]
MSIDKSLRRAGRLLRTRNVLKRTERIEKLEFEDRWQEGQSPFGLPKVRVIKSTIGRKKKKKKEEEEGAEEGLETLETPEEE